MTDINKQIAKSIKECRTKDVMYNLGLNDGAMIASTTIKRHFSWRKVSEGLPEVKTKDYFVNVKFLGYEDIPTAILIPSDIEDLESLLESVSIVEWKPID